MEDEHMRKEEVGRGDSSYQSEVESCAKSILSSSAGTMEKLGSGERKQWSWKEVGDMEMMRIKLITIDPCVLPLPQPLYTGCCYMHLKAKLRGTCGGKTHWLMKVGQHGWKTRVHHTLGPLINTVYVVKGFSRLRLLKYQIWAFCIILLLFVEYYKSYYLDLL